LDPNLILRRPTAGDAPSVVDLVNAADAHDYGEVDMDIDDIREDWAGLDLQTDAWLVESAHGGELIGYASLTNKANVQLRAYVCVPPEQRRRGIGSELVRLVEARGQQLVPLAPADARVVLVGWLKGSSAPEMRWARTLGYEFRRSFLRMRIEMKQPPPAPDWPPGISVRTYRPEDARSVFEVVEEAFSDHWGHVPSTFEEWRRRTRRTDFDPSLWSLAIEADTIVGTSLCETMADGGWVASLCVRRPWRNRGVARAMLLHSFAEFWRRDRRTISLGVDADSLTGATRLYESVGMHTRQRYDQVGKVLRDGIDTETRTISA